MIHGIQLLSVDNAKKWISLLISKSSHFARLPSPVIYREPMMPSEVPLLSRVNLPLDYHFLIVHTLKISIEVLEHLRLILLWHLHLSKLGCELLTILGWLLHLLEISLLLHLIGLVHLPLLDKKLIILVHAKAFERSVLRVLEVASVVERLLAGELLQGLALDLRQVVDCLFGANLRVGWDVVVSVKLR